MRRHKNKWQPIDRHKDIGVVAKTLQSKTLAVKWASEEHERIVQSGGSVSQEMDDDARVDGVLAMSRALGDHELKYYTHPQSQEYGPVSSRPEIQSISLENDQKYLAVLASDGLWDVVDNEKALKYVHHFGVAQAAKPLTSFALEKGSSDNITTLVVQL